MIRKRKHIERRAKPESSSDFSVDLSAFEIFAVSVGLSVTKIIDVKKSGRFHKRQHSLSVRAVFGNLFYVPVVVRKRKPRPFGKVFDRADVIEIFHRFDESYHVAAPTATETFEKLPRRVDRKRRRFFGMSRQRTTRPIIDVAAFLQYAIFARDVHYVVFGFEFAYEFFVERHYPLTSLRFVFLNIYSA